MLPDEAAYRLIEEARLRCQRRRDLPGHWDHRLWGNAYRELGMAGYLTSTEIPSGKRRALLAQARERSLEPTRGAVGDEYTVLRLITAAASQAVEALLVPALADHVQAATEHLAQARQILVHALYEQRTRTTSAA